MPSDARKLLVVSPEFYDWAREFVVRTIAQADALKAAGRPLASSKEYLLYQKILRALDKHDDKYLRLARKEAKILWREANKVVDHLTERVLPEYDRRISKDPSSMATYQPYIEKARKSKAMLVLGIAELRRLL